MNIISDRDLLEQIEGFIEKHGIAPSRFGLEAMGDGALIPQLREGRSLSLRNARRIADFMVNYPSTADRAA